MPGCAWIATVAAFKDNVDVDAVAAVAAAMAAGEPSFPTERFRALAVDGLDELELKARVMHVAAALRECLPDSFPTAAAIVRRGVGRTGLDGWPAWPCTEWVALAGTDHLDRSLELLSFLTSRWSAEFAIRPFLRRHPEQVLATLHTWCDARDEHVRRLVSEGTRPRLPWGERLVEFQRDPSPTIELLDRLYTDGSDYVRRSVANHLNDISKDHPEVAVSTAARWLARADDDTAAVVRHGLRSLVKAGDADALRLLGFDHHAPIRVESFAVTTPTVTLGQTLDFEATLSHDDEEALPVVVDFGIHHIRADGSRSPKVFKLTTRSLPPNTPTVITKRHRIKAVTVRRYYSGTHVVDLMVNGRVVSTATFELLTPDPT
jgi:3-methyladenine DNA glycosylase AlkC